MDRFGKSHLKDLLTRPAQPCLSLYMPAHRAGAEVQQNPIRFKNLLKQAEDSLRGYGLRGPEAREFLEKAREQLLMNGTFWQQQSDGLAVFVAPDIFQYYRLPLAFEEVVVVDDRFHLKPLFELFQNQGHFYILALSQNEVRLLEGTKYRVEAIDLKDVPLSLAEALKWDDPEKQLQHHTVSSGREGGERGPSEMAFHGHGVGTDDQKTNLLRFFQKLDQGLRDYLADERVPLVLAGVEYLFPIYQEANSYNDLMEKGIPGNPEELSEETLHTHAWELLAPFFQKEQDEAAALYQQHAGRQTGQASNDIEEIIPAAYSGRVQQLFVREGTEIWGHYDLANNRVEIERERTPTGEELLNTAVLYTFQNSGVIYLVGESEMPDPAAIAAVFRY